MASSQNIRRAAVLGAGTMGAQIAALFTNKGIPCDLLDLRYNDEEPSRIAEQAIVRLTTMRPSPIEGLDSIKLIRPGNFDDHLDRLSQADWVIEAVIERLEPKLELWRKVVPYIGPDTIVSTNTSGIPITQLAEALPQEVRPRFLGTHFFNPPRYLKLLEIIPSPETEDAVIDSVRKFAENVLEKGVVLAHDVPGFITNRIGLYSFLVTLRAADEFGLSPDEVDAITGQVMGRPNSATYRTIDLVGLDIFADICDNTRAALTEPLEQEGYEVPAYVREMVNNGWLGEKSGQGFYKRIRQDGKSEIHALDTSEMAYQPRQRVKSELLESLSQIDDAGQRIKALVESDHKYGQFAWRILSQLLSYAAVKREEVADGIQSIDNAMCWGFGWTLGPFQTWDLLGMSETTERMKSDGLQIPDWVAEIAGQRGSFY